MPFERLSSLVHSLRFRLTFWNTGVVLLMVIVALVAVHEGLRITLLKEIDQRLVEDTREFEETLQSFRNDPREAYAEMERKAKTHSDERLFLQQIGADGQPIWSSSNTPLGDQMIVPQGEVRSPRNAGKFRIAERPLSMDGVSSGWVRVGASREALEETVAKRTEVMGVVGFAIFLLAPLGGYWLAGQATRPLAYINQTTAGLRPSQMDERLPLAGTGDELDQLSGTINHFLDQIGDYLDRNREFVANAAHELRSPLAAIQSSAEVSLNADRSIDEYKDLLSEICDQCTGLGALVNQLLLLAESDAGGPQAARESVHLDRLVETSLEMFRGVAEDKGVELNLRKTSCVPVLGDVHRLAQVVNNLVDNALKFTPKGGQVLVDLRHEAARHVMIFRVADTGCGISAADLPHIFDRFYRGDKSRQRENATRGNGLGLSICKSILFTHGGQIEVDSSPGKGARFTVTLPAVNEETPAATHDDRRIPEVSATSVML